MSDSDTARRVDRARTDVRGHTMSRAARWKLLAAGPRSWGLGTQVPPPVGSKERSPVGGVDVNDVSHV